MNRNSTNIVIGLIFILLGVGFFIDQLGLNLGFSISSFWPILIILIGLYMLTRRSFLAGFIISGVGIAFLVNEFTDIDAFSLFWPLIIVGIGLSLLFRPSPRHWVRDDTISSDRIDESIIFWGLDKKVVSKNFRGGKIDAIFGGFELDLRECELSSDGAKLEVNVIFGGGEVWVSENMRVEAHGTGIFGGWENKFRSENDSSKPLLKINGSAIFGGIEIKNK